MSAQLKRHIGKLKNTDRRCVIVYMQIPNKEDHALIVDTDALPDQFHEFLMDVVESETAQHSVNLADVLDRRASPDSGMNLMNSFHARGYLRPERIDNIIMMPRPNMPFPLSKVIELSKKEKTSVVEDVMESRDKFNQHTENLNIDAQEGQLNMAKSILMDAKLLEEEAQRKRNKAYEIAPSLRPRTGNNAGSMLMETDEPVVDDIPIAVVAPVMKTNVLADPEQTQMQMIVEQAQRDLERMTSNEIPPLPEVKKEPLKKNRRR